MKKTEKILALLLVLLLGLCACAPAAEPVQSPEVTEEPTAEPDVQETEPAAEPLYQAGVYTASARGNNGDVTVEVTLSETAITAVKVTEHSETAGISDPAIDRIPAAIVDGQTLAVDTVSGATNTSRAILTAAEDCIAQAGGDVEALKTAGEEAGQQQDVTELTCDIVVVGGGGTGLAAAAAAKDQGADVIVIEKLASVGGSTKLAGGALAAAGTIYQKEAGIEDSKEDWFNYWINDQKGSYVECEYPDEARLDSMMDEAVVTVEWIGETIGLEYATPRPFGWGGPSRAHVAAASPIPASGRGSSGGGVFLIEALENYVKDGLKIMTETAGTTLITNDAGDVIGVNAEGTDGNYAIYADSVILATGGFAHNAEMLEKYLPGTSYYRYADISSACVGDTGDGIRMATEVGAVMYDDPWIIGLTCKSNIAEANSALTTKDKFKDSCFVDQNGRRFINEDIAYMTSSIAAVDTAWELIDSSDPERASILETNMDGVEIVKGETWEELAQAMGADPAVLAQTMALYNEAAKTGDDTEFHKMSEFIVALETAPYYAVKVCPVTGGTLGGVKTNEKFQVTRADGSVIKGLYAGGECANKIYYNQVYTSGSGLTIAITSGRIAGETAAADLK